MTYRRNLPLLLLTVRELVRSHFQPTFRDFGITEQQWRILRLLQERDGLGVTEIGDACLIFRASIVVIIARMEEIGLVTRRPVSKDRRRSQIFLTPAGKDMVEQILPIFEGIYGELEKYIGSAKLNELYRVLDDVSAKLGELATEQEIEGGQAKRKIIVSGS